MNQHTALHRYGQVPASNGKVQTIATGNKKLDPWLSRYGGFVRGTWMFLTGTAGAGKTSLIVFLQSLFKGYKTILWSLEMSAVAVERQCGRFDARHGSAFIADSESCPTFEAFMALLEKEKPDVIAIDSIQMVADLLVKKGMGEEDAINHVKDVLRLFNEKNNSVLIFIGQMTKGGVFKGPQAILQLADAHMEMTYYRKTNERKLSWGGKNRNGSDPSAKLFYTFGKDDINFFTPDEWNIEKHKMTFTDFMMAAAYRYLDAMKGREGYASVSKALKKKEAELSGLGDEAFLLAMTKEITEAVNQTWPVAQ